MRSIICLALIALFQYSTCTPVQDDVDCRQFYSDTVCDDFDALKEMTDKNQRLKRQLPPIGGGTCADGGLIDVVLKKKLEFCIQHGLFKAIPFIGQAVHDMIANDIEGATCTLKDVLGGVVDLVIKGVNPLNLGGIIAALSGILG